MRQAEIPVAAAYPLPKQLKREQSLFRRFGHIARASRGNTGGFAEGLEWVICTGSIKAGSRPEDA
jgi:hypothetical protein